MADNVECEVTVLDTAALFMSHVTDLFLDYFIYQNSFTMFLKVIDVRSVI